MFTLSASFNIDVWSKDVTEVHYLKLLKPLTDLSYSGNTWLQRYNEYLTKQLKVTLTDRGMCFYYARQNSKINELLTVHVDNTLAANKKKFKDLT